MIANSSQQAAGSKIPQLLFFFDILSCPQAAAIEGQLQRNRSDLDRRRTAAVDSADSLRLPIGNWPRKILNELAERRRGKCNQLPQGLLQSEM